ncbi:MAG: peptide chain release factor N(5)-glutamine methyltransferase [Chlamydiae bacterium]|nr:peptide chain release factor N(5)-glutamine methyltransferase [Chlamydiota bacterium]
MKEIEFYHSRLWTDPDYALEPRLETELLVEKIALRHKKNPPKDLADICCGCGTIGIPLKIALKDANVYFVDISSKALELLRKNLSHNDLVGEVFQGDLLDPLIQKQIKVDLLVCNPPYVATNEIDLLDANALKEPSIALFGGEDGLDFYRRLANDLPKVLKKGASVYFEIGFNQGKRLLELFDLPWYKNQRVENDYAGHNRFFSLVFEPYSLLES